MPVSRALPGPLGGWVALVATALAVPACGMGGADAETDSGPKPITVELTTVESGLLRDVVTFNGQLSAEQSVVLKSETDGVIEEVLFREGESAEKGRVLFRLRDDEQEARLREARANLQLASEVWNRIHKLVTRDAASQAQKDESAAQLAVARSRVEVAAVELARTEIRAPFDGVLGIRLVDRGARISDETPLVQIDQVDRLQVAFAISELGILFTRVGAPVEVSVAPYPDEVFPGEVFFVSPTLDPATRRIVAKAWVPNEDRRLRAGLFASVDMEIGRRENAILAPESAIVFDRKGTYVWKIDGEGVATRVPVEVGLRKEGRVEVTLGLRDGDRIVTAGTHKVNEGSVVRVVSAGAEAVGQARRPEAGGATGEGT